MRDLSGERFYYWTAIERSDGVDKYGHIVRSWLCRCDCGTEKVINENNLISGKSKSCGCYRNKRTSESSLIDLTGMRFGRLTVECRVTEYEGVSHGSQAKWKCRCDCGNTKIVSGNALRSKKTSSCGCLQKETLKKHAEKITKHGMWNTRLYRIWRAMKSRCLNQNDSCYYKYGAKGVTVCDEWINSFETFCCWSVENGYNDNLTIDRIDVYKGYSPDNCRWATLKQQANNKTNNRIITYKGESHTVSEWADILNISVSTIRNRIYKRWDTEKVLSKPKRKFKTAS